MSCWRMFTPTNGRVHFHILDYYLDFELRFKLIAVVVDIEWTAVVGFCFKLLRKALRESLLIFFSSVSLLNCFLPITSQWAV